MITNDTFNGLVFERDKVKTLLENSSSFEHSAMLEYIMDRRFAGWNKADNCIFTRGWDVSAYDILFSFFQEGKIAFEDLLAAYNRVTFSGINPKFESYYIPGGKVIGFSLVGTNTTFDRNTKWAIREFACYAKMTKVAHVKQNAERICKHGADFVAQMGENETANLSHYVNSLEQIDNACIYNGPVIEKPVKQLTDIIHFWIDNNYRCPVIMEVWSVNGVSRVNLNKCNIWKYDDYNIDSVKKVFVKNFTDYYNVPATRSNEPMNILGYFYNYSSSFKGPVSLRGQCWVPECEITAATLIGSEPSSDAQDSTYQVVKYVSRNECFGLFDCINAYDRCIVSFGPCHWTFCMINPETLVVDNGELGGFLSYLQHVDKVAFSKAIGNFGIKAEEWDRGFGNGSSLYSSQRKFTGWFKYLANDSTWCNIPKTVEDVNYFKNWHWFFRFSFAGKTIEGFRRRMYDMTRIRIRDIAQCPWPTTVDTPWQNYLSVTIGDVFNSEQTIALLTRMHVFAPSWVIGTNITRNIPHLTLQKARYSTAGQLLNWNTAPNT